jgi:hypothetical protein
VRPALLAVPLVAGAVLLLLTPASLAGSRLEERCFVWNPALLASDRDVVVYDGRKRRSYEICIFDGAPETQIVEIILDRSTKVVLYGAAKRSCKDVAAKHIRLTIAGAFAPVDSCPAP